MTAKELIKVLSGCAEDAKVIISYGDEKDGYVQLDFKVNYIEDRKVVDIEIESEC